MSSYLEAHVFDIVSAVASTAAAGVAVLVYLRQTDDDHRVGWQVERTEDNRIILVRTGAGVARDVVFTFDAAAQALTQPPQSTAPVGPGARVTVGFTSPRSAYLAAGHIEVAWKQRRLFRTTSHTWLSQLP